MSECHCTTCQLDLILAASDLTLAGLTQLRQEMRAMTEATARIDTAVAGIQGDIDGLKAAAAAAAEANAALQVALDQALADQGAAVAAAVEAAVAAEKAAAEAANTELAARLEAIDSQTAPVEPPAEPVV